VRRNGVYKGSAGDRDFNAELFEPISRHLASGWERVFQRRLPAALSEFETTAQGHLETFHQAAVSRARERFANAATPFLLTNQIGTHKITLQDLPNQVAAKVTELQRQASRESVPVILSAMTGTYELCTAERGTALLATRNALTWLLTGWADRTRLLCPHEVGNGRPCRNSAQYHVPPSHRCRQEAP